ncbi:unnamed protein product [Rhizophagus irregularis]|uniref:Uncharacterized protein n=1 Tax=Rhizophagus irregularis TaxID=588596 RepID=A0A915YSA3_9GLOM|nr:unnamed protein product [Rhizophagus irregularis]
MSTNNETKKLAKIYESGYYNSFIDFYKYINSEISEKLKINYKNDKESPFVKGWWHGIGINNYESLLEFSQGFNFESNQVILKDKASENLYLNQYEKIEWILKSNKNVFLIFKEILKDVETKYYDSIQSCIIDCTPSSRKKYYKLFTEDEWNEICDANLLSYQEDDFIIYSSISSHIKKLFKWIKDKQSNILTLPLPLFEENELNIEANIYNFILQSMEKNFWCHNEEYLKEISEIQFTSNILYDIFNHIFYFLNKNLKVQLGDKMNLGFQNRKHLSNQLFNNKNNSDYGRKSDFFVNDNQNNVFLLAEVTGPPYKRKPKKELFDYSRNHRNGKDELEYRNLSIIYKYGPSLTEEHIEKLMKVINIFLLQIHTNVLSINILDQPGSNLYRSKIFIDKIKIPLQRNKEEVLTFIKIIINIYKKIIDYYNVFNDILNSLNQDKNSSQPDEYLTKPLSIHANQLLYSSAITCPTPRSSPERDIFSNTHYTSIFNQNFDNLQEFQKYIDNLNKNNNTQDYKELIWLSPHINPTILNEEDISYEKI